MRFTHSIVLSALMLPAVALAQTSGVSAGAGPGPMTTPMSPAPAGNISMQDQHFIDVAAKSGLAEVQQGQLAQSNGDAAVQTLGAQMVTDHTKANEQLKIIATQLGATVPTAPMAKDAMMAQNLQALHGAAFDTKYLHGQKLAHEHAIAAFQTEIASGNNGQLKSFAKQTLPILEDHLKMIEQTTEKSA